jgi:hypothetical protein
MTTNPFNFIYCSMIKALNAYKKEDLVKREGEDFLFLFDLIAHTCGLPATLRVLSYTAPKFERLCQPVVMPERDLVLTETSLGVSWSPAPLEASRKEETSGKGRHYTFEWVSGVERAE